MSLTEAVVQALVANPREIATNTPPEVLAAHMVRSLQAFEASLLERAHHPFFAPARAYAPPTVVPARAAAPAPDGSGCGLYRDMPGHCQNCED